MSYPVSMLDQIVSGDNIFRITVFDVLKRSILPIFCFAAVHDSHSDLEREIIHIVPEEDGLTFQFADPSEVDGGGINDILKRRSVINPFIGFQSKIETEIGKIVLLFSGDQSTGSPINSLTRVNDLSFLKNMKMTVQCLSLDGAACFFRSAVMLVKLIVAPKLLMT